MDSSGNYICSDAFQGLRNYWRKSEYDWPIQTRPFKKLWTLWQRVIKITFAPINRKLSQSLGLWLEN